MKQEFNGAVGTFWQYIDVAEMIDFTPEPFYTIESELEVMTKWCIDFDGVGMFYRDPIFDLIYFECDEDREIFLMRWKV